ncbi:polysaccharide deacetylase family protein [Desulfitobacterium sp. Sab5]|uniref:polysaccharide deacetylase family protein n=1 Tax=Desulfitobacterium nosdiversum TaxID=3375356 RepID=UPI003CEE968F
MPSKRTIFLLLGSLLILTSFGAYASSHHYFQRDNNSSPSASSSDMASQGSTSSSEVLTNSSEPVSPSNPSVLEILGQSRKLTSQELNSMQKWRQEIAQIAKANPDWVFLNGPTSEKKVALTFDDGPDGSVTPKILDTLSRYHVNANFFFIGQNAKAYPAIVKRAFNEGNLVLNHSYSHPQFTQKSEAFITHELDQTDTLLKTLTGSTPEFIRPPYGIVTDQVLNVAKARGQKLIIWSTDTLDWSQKEKENIVQNVLLNVRPGEIILMHSNGDKQATAEALPAIIEGLQAKGYKIVTLKELLQ